MAQVVSPSSGTEAVGPLLMGSNVGCLPGIPGLVGRAQLLPMLRGKVLAARRRVEARTVKVWSMTGRRALAALHWASSSRKMYWGMSGIPS